MEPTPPISIDQFALVDLRIGRIDSAVRVEGSKKLLKLMVHLGKPEEGGCGDRQILSGIAGYHEPESLAGKSVVVLTNLAPRMMMGLESQGMILAVGDTAVLLQPETEVAPGTKIR